MMLVQANALQIPLADNSVNCVVTSPPYHALRSYNTGDNKGMELGRERTVQEYVANMVTVFEEVRRVLRPDGVCFINIGDTYAGSGGAHRDANNPGLNRSFYREGAVPQRRYGTMGQIPPKNLCLVPERLAIALQDAGWWVRQRIAWIKAACLPESVKDRPTSAWEHVWMLTKGEHYYWGYEAVRQPHKPDTERRYNTPFTGSRGVQDPDGERRIYPKGLREFKPGANMRNYLAAEPEEVENPYLFLGPDGEKKVAHFATFPRDLVRPFILAGCPADGIVLDPFVGSGTTLVVAQELGRQGIGLDLSAAYLAMARERIAQAPIPLFPIVAEHLSLFPGEVCNA